MSFAINNAGTTGLYNNPFGGYNTGLTSGLQQNSSIFAGYGSTGLGQMGIPQMPQMSQGNDMTSFLGQMTMMLLQTLLNDKNKVTVEQETIQK